MFTWLTVGFYFAKSNTFEISLDGNVENNLAIEYTYTLNINIYLFMNRYIHYIWTLWPWGSTPVFSNKIWAFEWNPDW